MTDRSYSTFPLWLELSGLPAYIHEKAKSGFAWSVFHKIVELDIAANRSAPGLVEISINDLGDRCGLDEKKINTAIKGLRKAKVLRAFLPDNAEETALFQMITPIPTPKTPDEVRAHHPDLFLETPWPPRYAVAAEEPGDSEDDKAKIKRVVDLYLDCFSMKMNSLILDELQLIADRYDEELIKKVFDRARERGASSLGWIMSEIRREMKIKAKAQELKDRES